MILSQASRNLLELIAQNGGSIDVKGNQRSGDALEKRKLVKIKQGRYWMTAAGRKWMQKN